MRGMDYGTIPRTSSTGHVYTDEEIADLAIDDMEKRRGNRLNLMKKSNLDPRPPLNFDRGETKR